MSVRRRTGCVESALAVLMLTNDSTSTPHSAIIEEPVHVDAMPAF